MRPLVRNDSEIATNFYTFIKLRESKKPKERQKYEAYLRQAKILVVEKIDGRREYAPSRFVGYQRNTLATHEADVERNGTVTTPEIEKIYDRKWTFDPEESERFITFCKEYGITKETAHLQTPIKFIFSGSYTPSPSATRNKPSQLIRPEAEAPSTTVNSYVTTASLNQILYGPPGTGKTYHTAVRAIGLLEGKTDEQVISNYSSRQDLRLQYNNYQRAGRIQFVTFHQSFSYEDFVEGIKPLAPDISGQVKYGVVDGVFKRICLESASQTLTFATPYTANDKEESDDFDQLFDKLIEELRYYLAKNKVGKIETQSGRKITIYEVSNNLIWYRFSDHKNHHITRNTLRPYFQHYNSLSNSDNEEPDLSNYAASQKKLLSRHYFAYEKKQNCLELIAKFNYESKIIISSSSSTK